MEARDASRRRETEAPTRSQKGGRTSPRGQQQGQSKTKEQGQRQGEKRRANLENLDILLKKNQQSHHRPSATGDFSLERYAGELRSLG